MRDRSRVRLQPQLKKRTAGARAAYQSRSATSENPRLPQPSDSVRKPNATSLARANWDTPQETQTTGIARGTAGRSARPDKWHSWRKAKGPLQAQPGSPETGRPETRRSLP